MPEVKNRDGKRPWSLWVVFVILILLSIAALPPGWAMITDSSGSSMGMSTDWLLNPFLSSYLIPGLFLFVVIGLGSLFVAAALLLRPHSDWAQRLNPFRNMGWQWSAGVALGMVVMFWIVIQVLSIALFSWLQPVVFSVGVLITLLMFEPSMRRYFAKSAAPARA